MTEGTGKNRVEREARLRWVPIGLMCVSPVAQRDLNPARVDKIAAGFDLEQIGTPTVNHRDGRWFIVDGQHRIEALRQIGWGDQQIQCWAYEGLTEAEEAETFLKINDVLAVNAFARFRTAVTAGRVVECDIDRIVRHADMSVSLNGTPGAISAVGTLVRSYHRDGPGPLSRALRLIRDGFGDSGLTAAVIDGMALVCARYGSELADEAIVTRMRNLRGGVAGLLNRAEAIRLKSGKQRGHCVAAAIVEAANQGRGGKKLADWWREDAA